MKNYILLFIFFIITLIESLAVSLPLTLVMIVALSVVDDESPPYPIAFIFGILLDLLTGRIVGLDSILFLIVVFIISLYRKKIVAHTMRYLLPFSTILVIGYNYIFFHFVTITQTVGSVASGVVLFFIIYFIVNRVQKGTKLSY